MKRLELEITNGELAGRRYEVKSGGLRLGRSSSNDIHVPDEELSRNHCLFETVGETGVRVTDLASANGTLVNGVPLGNDPLELKAGDLIEVGKTVIRVVGDEPPEVPLPMPGAVDLGLGEKAKPTAGGRRRSPLANILWGVAVVTGLAAIWLVLNSPQEERGPTAEVVAETVPTVREFGYEKVEATLEGIFRYEVTMAADGQIRVVLDDTKENRHPVVQPRKLSERARADLNDILAYATFRALDPEYSGAEPDVPSLTSWRLKVVYDDDVRTVRVVNTQEPEAFRAIREKLEAFCNNELGIQAIQYSREKLVSMAEEAIAVGKSKWEDRDVQHGNLFGSVSAYREALVYLETVEPKPDCVHAAREGLTAAQAELESRFRDQRFLAERAVKLGKWDDARRELQVLLEMVPDRNDDRNREASAKLIDVEKRIKGGK